MNLLAQTLVDGLMLGAGYTLLAVGFALVFGVSGVLNVAHPNIYMLGAYMAAFGSSFAAGGARLPVALLIGVVSGVVAGAVLHFVVLRHFKTDQHLPAFLATIGVALFLQFFVARIFSSRQRRFEPLIDVTVYNWGGIIVTSSQILVVGATVGFVSLLFLWINRTKIGRGMRAVAESEDAATVLGIRVVVVKLVTVCVASALAGVAGVLLANHFGAYSPFMGIILKLKMIVVVLVAGMGSISGPLVIGLGLGITEALTVLYAGSKWQHLGGLIVLLIVLIIRPNGLFGRAVRKG